MPPLHILKEKIIPEIAKDLRKTHFFSRTLEQTLNINTCLHRLGISEKKVEEKDHIPVKIFQY